MAEWGIEAIEVALDEAYEKTKSIDDLGNVASYIPALSEVNPKLFSLSIAYGNQLCSVGDTKTNFSIQSISKVVSLIMAIEKFGKEKVFEFVGMENCNKAFNDIGCIKNIPINPMVNAGAITVIGLLYEKYKEKTAFKLMELMKEFSDTDEINIDEKIFISEMNSCTMNRTLIYYLKHLNLIKDDCEKVLKQYLKACSISANTEIIAKIGNKIAMGGDGIIRKNTALVVNAIMSTCGMYENTGEYMLKVGIPSKSGVSGIIMATSPGKCGLAVYSPRLDKCGNSYRGIKILEILSEKLKLNIYER